MVRVVVATGETIWLVRAKDGDILIERGLVATTNPGGASKWRYEYSETLRGARVVILPELRGGLVDGFSRRLLGRAISVIEHLCL
jgi:hypothetical protein